MVASMLELLITGEDICRPLIGKWGCDSLLQTDKERSLSELRDQSGVLESRLHSLSVGEVGEYGSFDDIHIFRCSLPFKDQDGEETCPLVEPPWGSVSVSLEVDDGVFDAVIVTTSSWSAEAMGSAWTHPGTQ